MYKSFREIEEIIINSPIIGFDDYMFKKIFKRYPEYLKMLISGITQIDFKDEEFKFYDTIFKDGLSVKGTICDLLVRVEDESYEYGIDIESQEYQMKDAEFIDRALNAACVIYNSLHNKGDNYLGNKRVIVIYFFNDKYNPNKQIDKKPMIVTKLVEDYIGVNPVVHDDIAIYRINVNSVLKNGFENAIGNDKIIIEMLEVLSTFDISKYVNSKNEVIKKMAKEIKDVNDLENERWQAIANNLAKSKYYFDKNMPYVYGKAEGIEEGIKEGAIIQLKDNVSSMREAGFSNEEISKILKIDLEKVKSL